MAHVHKTGYTELIEYLKKNENNIVLVFDVDGELVQIVGDDYDEILIQCVGHYHSMNELMQGPQKEAKLPHCTYFFTGIHIDRDCKQKVFGKGNMNELEDILLLEAF